jgi:hypothetical protein
LEGNDYLSGGGATTADDGASDRLSGGGGSNTYRFGDGWGQDTIIDKQIPDNSTNTGNQVTFTSSSSTPGTLIINLVRIRGLCQRSVTNSEATP